MSCVTSLTDNKSYLKGVTNAFDKRPNCLLIIRSYGQTFQFNCQCFLFAIFLSIFGFSL